MYNYLFEILIFISLNIYPVVVLLDHIVAQFIVFLFFFLGTTIHFFPPNCSTNLYMYQQWVKGFCFLHILSSCHLVKVILIGTR